MSVKEQTKGCASEPLWATPLLGVATLLAIASASCCVLPIGLSLMGLGGTWLAVLGPFAAYRSMILISVGAVLIFVWARLMKRRESCARRRRTALSLAGFCSAVFLIAVSTPLWEQDAMQAMLVHWRGR